MKLYPDCDLLIGNKLESDSATQYSECEYCYRYDICKNAEIKFDESENSAISSKNDCK